MPEDRTNAPETREEAFARAVATNRAKLLRYALRRLQDHDAVEDVVSETLAVAWRRWSDWPGPEQELFWLFGIERLVVANAWRSARRRYRLQERLNAEQHVATTGPRFDASDVRAVIDALEAMSEDDQEAVRLAYWEELSFREIGVALGCSENAAEIRVRRARNAIRGRLHGHSEQLGLV